MRNNRVLLGRTELLLLESVRNLMREVYPDKYPSDKKVWNGDVISFCMLQTKESLEDTKKGIAAVTDLKEKELYPLF